MSFDHLGLHPTLLDQLARLGYERPSPIQNLVIPPVLGGQDVLAYAKDGTGRCDALLQSIIHQQYSQPTDDITHFILASTPSRASWIHRNLRKLSNGSIRTQLLAEIDSTNSQEKSPGKPTVIVATPDHLDQVVERDSLMLGRVKMIALDGADGMLDPRLRGLIAAIATKLPRPRQIIIFASSPSPHVTEMSEELQHAAVRICPDPSDYVPSGTAQLVWPVPRHLKMPLLLRLLDLFQPNGMLIIVQGRHFCLRITRKLRSRNISVGAIVHHSSDSQQVKTIEQFHSGVHKLIVMTGMPPPSLDINRVTHVVHYDFPRNAATYFSHLKATPQAVFINLVTPENEQALLEIEDQLGRPMRRDELPDFDYSTPPPDNNKGARSGGHHTSSKKAWDPETPRTWGDRNAPRKEPGKIPIEEWSPGPLPDIWLEEKTKSRSGKRAKPRRRGRSRRKSRRRSPRS